MPTHVNEIAHAVIGAAIEVHRRLGPGLLESAYQECLCRELVLSGIPFEYELKLPLEYKGMKLEHGYRVDLVVADLVVVEFKSIEAIAPIHEAQLPHVLTTWRMEGRLANQLQRSGPKAGHSPKSTGAARVNLCATFACSATLR